MEACPIQMETTPCKSEACCLFSHFFCLADVFLGVNIMLRKIAVKAASKPQVEITQDGETMSIKTSTTVRTTNITFTVGKEFNETTVDGRPCTVHNTWIQIYS